MFVAMILCKRCLLTCVLLDMEVGNLFSFVLLVLAAEISSPSAKLSDSFVVLRDIIRAFERGVLFVLAISELDATLLILSPSSSALIIQNMTTLCIYQYGALVPLCIKSVACL